MKHIVRIPLRKALIKISYRCNNRCVFCHARFNEDHPDLPAKAVIDRIRAAAEIGMEMVVFSGGEPTMRKDLPQFAAEAQRLGLPFGLVTNARVLSYKEYFDRLYALGLRYVLISLHGPDAELHDRLVGVESFEQTVAGLARCAAAGIVTTANTVITCANVGRLKEIAEFMRNFPGAAVKFAFVDPKGAALASFNKIVPEISTAARAVREILNSAHDTDSGCPRPVFCDGFTPCLIPDFDEYNDDLFTHGFEYMSEVFEDAFYPVDHGFRTFAESCGNCRAKDECPGIYKEYLDRCGADEFIPITD